MNDNFIFNGMVIGIAVVVILTAILLDKRLRNKLTSKEVWTKKNRLKMILFALFVAILLSIYTYVSITVCDSNNKPLIRFTDRIVNILAVILGPKDYLGRYDAGIPCKPIYN